MFLYYFKNGDLLLYGYECKRNFTKELKENDDIHHMKTCLESSMVITGIKEQTE